MTAEPPVEETVRWALDGAVATLTIDRPRARGALTPAMRDRMTALLTAASADLAVRTVVVTGTGDGFCAGADLRSHRPAPDRPAGAPEVAPGHVARVVRDGWQRLIAAVLDCEKPVIAAVNGIAAGAGVQLALACDLVLAADHARFVQAFVRRGLVPDAGAAYLLARLVGPQRAKELLFFSDDVPAARALELGLVNRVVPREELAKVAREWASTLAAGPTQALARTKALVNRALEQPRDAAFSDEATAQELVSATADFREGLAAFAARRPADFKGW